MRDELELEDTFADDALDLGRWIPHYLPHWSTRERSARVVDYVRGFRLAD